MVENKSRWVHDCLECAALCQAAAEHCLEQGGPLADAQLLRTLIAGAAVSELVGELAREDADLSLQVLRFLAETCERAAAACEPFESEHLRRCGAACLACAAAARSTLEAA